SIIEAGLRRFGYLAAGGGRCAVGLSHNTQVTIDPAARRVLLSPWRAARTYNGESLTRLSVGRQRRFWSLPLDVLPPFPSRPHAPDRHGVAAVLRHAADPRPDTRSGQGNRAAAARRRSDARR